MIPILFRRRERWCISAADGVAGEAAFVVMVGGAASAVKAVRERRTPNGPQWRFTWHFLAARRTNVASRVIQTGGRAFFKDTFKIFRSTPGPRPIQRITLASL